MILDILSRTTIYLIYSRTITGVLIDPIVFHIERFIVISLLSFGHYCPSLPHSYCLILLIVPDLDSLFCSVLDTHTLVYYVEQ